jgi:hypothetical protein
MIKIARSGLLAVCGLTFLFNIGGCNSSRKNEPDDKGGGAGGLLNGQKTGEVIGETAGVESIESAGSGDQAGRSGTVSGAGGTSGGSQADGKSEGGSPTSGESGGIGGSGGVTRLSGVAADALSFCSVITTANPQITFMDVPTSLTGAQFGLLDFVCHEGGFELSLCAGNTIELTSILIDKFPTSSSTSTPYTAHVMALGDQLCCVYLSYSAVPGSVSAPCGPAYPAQAAMSRCSIIPNPLDDQQTIKEVTVPSSLLQDPLWAARDAICSEGGYDLSSCAGKQATLVTGMENTTLEGNPEPKKAWILTLGSAVCCIWETDGAATPSLLARSCAL